MNAALDTLMTTLLTDMAALPHDQDDEAQGRYDAYNYTVERLATIALEQRSAAQRRAIESLLAVVQDHWIWKLRVSLLLPPDQAAYERGNAEGWHTLYDHLVALSLTGGKQR